LATLWADAFKRSWALWMPDIAIEWGLTRSLIGRSERKLTALLELERNCAELALAAQVNCTPSRNSQLPKGSAFSGQQQR